MLGYHRTLEIPRTTLMAGDRELCVLNAQNLIIELKSDVPVCRWESDATTEGPLRPDILSATFQLGPDFQDWAGFETIVIRVFEGSIRLGITGGEAP